MNSCRQALAAAALGLCALAAQAETVNFNGSLGASKALLMIDGTPRTLGVGDEYRGVKLVALDGDRAEVLIKGQRVALRIGATQVSMGGANSAGSGTQVVMTAGFGGHFTPSGSINGRATRFMIDTGASSVAMSLAEARRLGLNLDNARRGMASTANGVVMTQAITLNSVRIGDVEVFNVAASVVPSDMPHVLLGNSFLTRFQMRRENDTMTLVKRP